VYIQIPVRYQEIVIKGQITDNSAAGFNYKCTNFSFILTYQTKVKLRKMLLFLKWSTNMPKQ